MSLTYEQKIEEYKKWVLTHQKTPPKKLKVKFSDGGDMRSWGHNQRRYLKEFIEKNSGKPIPENFRKFQKMCEEIEEALDGKLDLQRDKSFLSKTDQYLEKTRELGRRPVISDECYFNNGRSMVDWYNSQNRLYKKEESVIFLENLSEEEVENLTPFLKMKRHLYQEGYCENPNNKVKPLTFEERTKEYLEYFQMKQQKTGVRHTLFSDGVNIEDWYRNQIRFLRSDRSKEKSLTETRKKEVELFARMENEMLKIKDIPIIRLSRMTKKEKISYLIQLLEGEIDPSLSKDNICFNEKDYYFPDEICINSWLKSNQKECEEYLGEYQLLWDDSKPLSFEEKILEYKKAAERLGKKLKVRDPYCFSDHSVAATWLARQERKVKEERKRESPISNLRMREIHMLALLDNYLYQLERTYQTHTLSTNSEKEKIKKKSQ